jgi:hypothetical protein
MSVGARMFKDSSFMGTLTLPSLPLTQSLSPIHMISSSTSGSLRYVDPWVVPTLSKVESYEAFMPLMKVEISYL